MTIKKIGFACKYSVLSQRGEIESVPELNNKTTTVTWLNRQTREIAEERLWELIQHNLTALYNVINKIGTLDESLRLFRIGSDILPVYTHNDWSYFYRKPDVLALCESGFSGVGEIARSRNVRLSFHPGQYCCVVSDSPDVVHRSIEELEYHADMLRWMGYGQSFQDFKCNVHLSGRLGIDGFEAAWNRMSLELRNTLTLENDEYQKNIDQLIKLKDKVAIVLDIHHHLISDSEYISASDERIKHIIDSWRVSGGIVADLRGEGDYLDWYCSGMGGFSMLADETGEETARWIKEKGYVAESVVTEEIKQDLASLGWHPVPWD